MLHKTLLRPQTSSGILCVTQKCVPIFKKDEFKEEQMLKRDSSMNKEWWANPTRGNERSFACLCSAKWIWAERCYDCFLSVYIGEVNRNRDFVNAFMSSSGRFPSLAMILRVGAVKVFNLQPPPLLLFMPSQDQAASGLGKEWAAAGLSFSNLQSLQKMQSVRGWNHFER